MSYQRVLTRIAALSVVAWVSASPAWAGPRRYVHASSCQEVGAGESGAINRSPFRITNVGTTYRDVICPIPLEPTDSGGVWLVLTVNVEDHHKTADIGWDICHRDIWVM